MGSKLNCTDFHFSVNIPQTTVGIGSAKGLGRIIESLGVNKIMVVTDKGLVKAGLLEKILPGLAEKGIPHLVFDRCEPNAPLDVIQQCFEIVKQESCDAIVGIGGGSTMDTAKLVSLLISTNGDILKYVGVNNIEPHVTKLAKILIPTTAGSGSEWSQNAVFLNKSTGIKSSMSSSYLMAQRVIIDPELMADMPASITAETGIDALTHAIEAYTTIKASMVSDMFAEQVIKIVSENLPVVYASGGQNMEARYNMALAAAFGLAAAMSTGGGGVLAHGMAYPLRDLAPVPVTHGVSVSILMPHVMEFQLISNLPRFARIAELMGENVQGLSVFDSAKRSIDAYKHLAKLVKVTARMRDVGIKREDIPKLVDSMFELRAFHATMNCRPASREDITHIFESAW